MNSCGNLQWLKFCHKNPSEGGRNLSGTSGCEISVDNSAFSVLKSGIGTQFGVDIFAGGKFCSIIDYNNAIIFLMLFYIFVE